MYNVAIVDEVASPNNVHICTKLPASRPVINNTPFVCYIVYLD